MELEYGVMESESDTSEYTESDEQEEHWEVNVDDIVKDFDVESDDDNENLTHTNGAAPAANGLLSVILMFITLWASFYGISATAINHLVKFLHYVFTVLAKNSQTFVTLSDVFPTSLYMVKKYLGIAGDKFSKYVICQKCGSLYEFNECFEKTITGFHPKVCKHIAFRNHPHPSRRQPCGHSLVKEIITKQGRKYYPRKTYRYCSIITSLCDILQRKSYLDHCELWRSRQVPDGVLCDIYDGIIWKQFPDSDGTLFFSKPYHIGLMLNCDWFQPYRHSEYSIGVLYLVILNLPRSVRFKPANIIIVGIIPGPSEPKKGMLNSYLRPLVKELNALWTDGCSVKHNSVSVTLHAALIATVCDIPATQKLGGFLGHNSHYPCWKCSKYFPYNESISRIDFSGVEVGFPRTHNEHKQNAVKTLEARTPSERNTLELNTGSRFTELMHLVYYDCIRFSIIDPMHNLFLGSSKRILQSQWMDNYLCRKDMVAIQQNIDNCTIPSNFGRIPRKLQSEFSCLTADEWKNWTILYSLISLHGILPSHHLTCWQLFVQACTIFCSPVLLVSDIDKANDLMRRFFVTSESLYGSSFLTLNMHLHLHLSDCFRDYGPPYGFWLFSFERFNGILGHYNTNQLSVEIQLMRRFIDDMTAKSLANTSDIPTEYHSHFTNLLCSNIPGTCADTIFGQYNHLSGNLNTFLSTAKSVVKPSLEYICDCPLELIPPFTLHKFDANSMMHLRNCYQTFLPEVDILEIPQLCKKYKVAQWWSQRIGNYRNNDKKSMCIQAYWANSHGKIECDCNDLCAGVIQYFFSQRILVAGEYRVVIMAEVKWFEEHTARHALMEPVELWYPDLFKTFGPASFMPLMRLYQTCVMCKIEVNREQVLAINPIRRKIFI